MLSSEHKAHLIGWASPRPPGSRTNGKHQTLCDVLTFSLSFLPVPITLPLSAHQCLLLSAKAVLLMYTPAAPQRFLPYQMTLGLKASCQTWYETWPLLGDLSPPYAPCWPQGSLCFSKSFFHDCNRTVSWPSNKTNRAQWVRKTEISSYVMGVNRYNIWY